MRIAHSWISIPAAVLFLALPPCTTAQTTDALPSWNDGPAKTAIITFVDRVTRAQSRDFVAPDKRIAVFDNDGTLWAEQPLYFQLAYANDVIKVLAPQHPEWHDTHPFAAVLDGKEQALAALSERDIVQLLTVSHAGTTTDAFAANVRSWLETARHPRFERRYDQLVYQPMLELLAYLRAHGFKTFIVSGGGVDFIRAFADKVYGVPPEQIVGSSGTTRFEISPAGTPTLVKQANVDFVDDGPGKPSGIHRFIGRRPIFAFGNSDGDLQMLQWTAGGGDVTFIGLVHHTDAKREYAYDRNARVGRLDKALDEAKRHDWTVVDMKTDWRTVFPPSRSDAPAH